MDFPAKRYFGVTDLAHRLAYLDELDIVLAATVKGIVGFRPGDDADKAPPVMLVPGAVRFVAHGRCFLASTLKYHHTGDRIREYELTEVCLKGPEQ